LIACLAAALWAFVLLRNGPAQRAQRHIDAGIEAMHTGQVKDAEREWQAAVRITPDNASLWELLSELYIKTEQWSEGTKALNQLLRIDPKRPYIYSRLAACALRSGNEVEAQRLAQEELKRNPGDEASLTILAFLSDMGENSEQHIGYLKRLLERRPDDAESLLSLSRAYYEAGKYAEIMPVVEKLIAVKPDEGDAYALRGAARYELDASPSASAQSEADLLKTLQIDPLRAFARFALGKVYMRQRKYAQAIFQLELAQKLYPRKMDVPFELATAYARTGQVSKAANARQRFETLRQQVTRVNVLQKQCSLDRNNFAAHLELGKFFLELEDHRKAWTYLRRALELNPRSVEAKQAYQQLSKQIAQDHGAPLAQ
jgi:protein O-GlcNAc transferase